MVGNLIITKLEVSKNSVAVKEKFTIRVYAKEKTPMPINQRLPFNLLRKPRI